MKILLPAAAGRRVSCARGGGLAVAAAFPRTCSNLKMLVLRRHQELRPFPSAHVLMKLSGADSDTYEGYMLFQGSGLGTVTHRTWRWPSWQG